MESSSEEKSTQEYDEHEFDENDDTVDDISYGVLSEHYTRELAREARRDYFQDLLK